MEESLENRLRHEGHQPSNEGGGMADGKVTQDDPQPCIRSRHGTRDSTFSLMPLLQSSSLSPSLFIEQMHCLKVQVPVCMLLLNLIILC